ncbi:MAG: ABC transporter permease [Dehalococcoidia bacterium]|nr:ABC transporter permease [Dehalococcoidia bacterium]MBL7165734.1 ABC transporter permease [Dehalococcoidales bacterium]
MRNYVIRRLALMVPTLFVITVVVFLSIRLIPGSAVEMMAIEMGSRESTGGQMDVAAVEKMLGMDVPVHIQYVRWMGVWRQDDGSFRGIFQGDFGTSLWLKRPVLPEIVARLPVTFELGLLAFIISQCIALPIGLLSAIRQDSVGDFFGRSFAIISLSIPGFWLGTMVMVFPAIWWGWAPPLNLIRFTDEPLANLRQFLIPGVLMGMAMSATTMRMLRTTMLEVLRQDYIRTAWAKGMRERVIVIRHAMRNAMIPVITMIAGQIPIMIGGSVIMEQIFALPGMGRLFLDSINRRDYPFVSSINVLLASFGLVLILLVDLSYAYLDPRIRYK